MLFQTESGCTTLSQSVICTNLLTNVIVRLTTAVDYSDDNATDMCSVRTASNWAMLIQIVSKES